MAIALVASIQSTTAQNGGTSGAIDTTGANLLVLSLGYYGTPTVSDSKGNTWVPLTAHVGASGTGIGHRIYYAKNAVVGTGHTITVTGTNTWPVIAFYAFSGADTAAPFVAENGAQSASTGLSGSLATGSVTPLANGSVVVSGYAGGNS